MLLDAWIDAEVAWAEKARTVDVAAHDRRVSETRTLLQIGKADVCQRVIDGLGLQAHITVDQSINVFGAERQKLTTQVLETMAKEHPEIEHMRLYRIHHGTT